MNDRKLRCAHRALALAVIVAFMATPAFAQNPSRPSWTCLPETTIGFIHAPSLRAAYESLRANTNLGRKVFHDGFSQEFLAFLNSDPRALADFNEGMKQLESYGLKLEDLFKAVDGDVGYAVATVRSPTKARPVGYFWIEPGEDVARRAFDALRKLATKPDAQEQGVKRVDSTLAGIDVTRVSVPVKRLDFDKIDFNSPDVEDPIQNKKSPPSAKRQSFPRIQVDQANVLFARIGGRLLFAHNFPTNSDIFQDAKESQGEKIDFDELSGVTDVTQAFGGFLAAHRASGSAAGLAALTDAPGLQAAMPKGMTLWEGYVHLGRMFEAIASADPSQAAVASSIVGANLGTAAMRATLDDRAVRLGMFLSVPSPRQGPLALLDFPSTVPEISAWVPSSADSFQQLNVDLGALWTKIRDLATQASPEAAAQLGVGDGMLRGFAGTDIAGLLGSLGSRHEVITMPAKPIEADNPGAAMLAMGGLGQRVAFVWQVRSEEPWRKLFELGANAGAQSGVKRVTEQGFTGLRYENELIKAGAFIGKGRLVVFLGEDISETLLAVLNSPPSGPNSLRGSPLAARAVALLPPRASFAYGLVDYSRMPKQVIEAIQASLSFGQRALRRGDQNDLATDSGGEEAFKKFRDLLPADEELDTLFGVYVSQAVVNQHGLVVEGALELPAGP